MTNAITEGWRMCAEFTSGHQRDYYKSMLKDANEVRCVSAEDVFTKKELEQVMAYCKIEPKMCYRTAFLLSNLFPERVRYVEGEVAMLNGAIGIPHAWNLVDGTHYVDLTFEYALHEDVTKKTYVMVGNYDVDVVRDVALETGLYGNVYNELFLRKIKSNNKLKKKGTRK